MEIESFFSIANKNIIAKEMSDLDIDNRYEEFYNDIKIATISSHIKKVISQKRILSRRKEKLCMKKTRKKNYYQQNKKIQEI